MLERGRAYRPCHALEFLVQLGDARCVVEPPSPVNVTDQRPAASKLSVSGSAKNPQVVPSVALNGTATGRPLAPWRHDLAVQFPAVDRRREPAAVIRPSRDQLPGVVSMPRNATRSSLADGVDLELPPICARLAARKAVRRPASGAWRDSLRAAGRGSAANTMQWPAASPRRQRGDGGPETRRESGRAMRSCGSDGWRWMRLELQRRAYLVDEILAAVLAHVLDDDRPELARGVEVDAEFGERGRKARPPTRAVASAEQRSEATRERAQCARRRRLPQQLVGARARRPRTARSRAC